MIAISTLKSRSGEYTSVEYDPGRLEPLAVAGKVDTYIVATEDGFSPLGLNLPFLSEDLGISVDELKLLADWNRLDNARVSIVALRSRRPDSYLRGVMLAASETSECYKAFALPGFRPPFRDFFYNVTYEAIAFAAQSWSSRRLAISHLSASGKFHEDIATCNAEALAHYSDSDRGQIQSLIFLGCCISPRDFEGIKRLYSVGEAGTHRPIRTTIENRGQVTVLHLTWGAEA